MAISHLVTLAGITMAVEIPPTTTDLATEILQVDTIKVIGTNTTIMLTMVRTLSCRVTRYLVNSSATLNPTITAVVQMRVSVGFRALVITIIIKAMLLISSEQRAVSVETSSTSKASAI